MAYNSAVFRIGWNYFSGPAFYSLIDKAYFYRPLGDYPYTKQKRGILHEKTTTSLRDNIF